MGAAASKLGSCVDTCKQCANRNKVDPNQGDATGADGSLHTPSPASSPAKLSEGSPLKSASKL